VGEGGLVATVKAADQCCAEVAGFGPRSRYRQLECGGRGTGCGSSARVGGRSPWRALCRQVGEEMVIAAVAP
jgi:hypothetical protein